MNSYRYELYWYEIFHRYHVNKYRAISKNRDELVPEWNSYWYLVNTPLKIFDNVSRGFDHLLSLVAPFVTKEHCRSRSPISTSERLCLYLRYLATGESQQSLPLSFRMGKATVSNSAKRDLPCKLEGVAREISQSSTNSWGMGKDWKPCLKQMSVAINEHSGFGA